MRITSALANKMIKQLDEEKSFLLDEERSGSFYDATEDEEPIVPEYDYEKTSEKLAEIDRKIVKIKHALNVQNTCARIQVGDKVMSVDEILVTLSQLNSRRCSLSHLRGAVSKERLGLRFASSQRTVVTEYRYANFDVEKAKKDYEAVSQKITEMQLALDTYNQTEMFEADI